MSADLKERLIEEFKAYENSLNGSGDSWIFNLRKTAMEKFEAEGFPTKKHEEWKYTNLAFLNKYDFNLAAERVKPQISKEDLEVFLFEEVRDNLLVVYNGYFQKELSQIQPNSGIILCGLEEAFEKYPDLIERHYGKYLNDRGETFTALNTAFSKDGVFVYVPENAQIDKNIHLLILNDTENEAVFSNTRNLIIAEKNSEARIIQTCYGFGKNPGLSNVVTEVFTGRDARFDFYKIHNCKGNAYYIGGTNVWQEKNSVFGNISISLSGKFQRNIVNARHNGERCETNYYGLYIMSGEDFIDNRTLVDHALPNCASNENYRGIIEDNAHAVFNGKILVRPNAQKTKAYQSNKNILLSNNATINTKPQLEIFADDVECSHGATSGYLDKDALFYLKARGVAEGKAKALLLNAFASEILEKINIGELRDAIKKLVAKRLCFDDIYFCEILENKEYKLT